MDKSKNKLHVCLTGYFHYRMSPGPAGALRLGTGLNTSQVDLRNCIISRINSRNCGLLFQAEPWLDRGAYLLPHLPEKLRHHFEEVRERSQRRSSLSPDCYRLVFVWSCRIRNTAPNCLCDRKDPGRLLWHKASTDWCCSVLAGSPSTKGED